MESFLNKLKEVWYIVLAIISLTIWYANTNSRISAVEAKQLEQTTINQKLLDKFDTINTNVYLLCVNNSVKCKDVN